MNVPARRRARSLSALVTLALFGLTACGGADPPPAAPTPPPVPPASSPPSPVPTTTTTSKARERDPLTGGAVSGRPVLAVKVENTTAARPQVGLSQADIVFVQEVEGAQTRLVAVYHSKLPKRLGPVRSARTTDAQLLPLFGRPGLVYSGANKRVQRKLDDASLVPIYRETRDRRRRAPHNVFVDLDQVARAVRLPDAKPIGWTFGGEPASGARPGDEATSRVGNDTFRFAYADGRYTVTWRGERYTDGDSGAAAKADNVVVMRVRNVPDGNRDVRGSASVLSQTVGRGKVTLHRDGVTVDGTWSRARPAAPLRFTDSAGRDLALKPGQTWVTLQG